MTYVFKIASVFDGAPNPSGELATLPRPSSREGLLALDNRSFALSMLRLRVYFCPLNELKPNSAYMLLAQRHPVG